VSIARAQFTIGSIRKRLDNKTTIDKFRTNTIGIWIEMFLILATDCSKLIKIAKTKTDFLHARKIQW
jgi:hypothetical protein